MKGPDHYLAGERHLRWVEQACRTGFAGDLEVAIAQMVATIAQAHFAAAAAAAVAPSVRYLAGLPGDNPGGDRQAHVGLPTASRWEQVLVDDPDPELNIGRDGGPS